MYFSARTEGRISYGHLGRTNSCLLLSLIATIWYKLYNLASRGAARDHRKLTSGADGHLADGRSRHVVVDELSNLHQHQRVHVMRDVEVPVDDGADETRARQRITAARHSRRRYRCAHKMHRSNIPPDAMHKLKCGTKRRPVSVCHTRIMYRKKMKMSNFFSRPNNLHRSSFLTPSIVTQFKENPLCGGVKYWLGGEIRSFRPIYWKQYKTGPWLLWNTNRYSIDPCQF